MAKRRKRSVAPTRPADPGSIARSGRGTLRSYTIGALPILNRIFQRLKLEEFFQTYLPAPGRRGRLCAAKSLLVLLRNLLVSREPIYGVGEWAARHAPDLVGLSPEQIGLLNDDRVGRALDALFLADTPSLVLAVVGHAVRQFGVTLEQLHNDSTTITFCGAYRTAAQEKRYLGRPTLAITFGHNKDHRPDLKQLLYILTVSADGGVPVHFRAESGNTTDDQTHRQTWELRLISGRRDFLYVADSKLATTENMAYLHQRGGRFAASCRGPAMRRPTSANACAKGRSSGGRCGTRPTNGENSWTASRSATNRPSPPKATGSSGTTARGRPRWTPPPAPARSIARCGDWANCG